MTPLAKKLCVAAAGFLATGGLVAIVVLSVLLVEERAVGPSLIVVDMQNDFMDIDGAALPVKDATKVIPQVNTLVRDSKWEHVIFTSDYHPATHVSFADSHPGSLKPYTSVDVAYASDGRLCHDATTWGESAAACTSEEQVFRYSQELWPKHCVQGTRGQQFHKDVVVPENAVVVRKGINNVVDSYGAFESGLAKHVKDKKVLRSLEENPLDSLLKDKGVEKLVVVGIAYDFCVKHTAIQAAKRGYKVCVIKDVTKSVFPDVSKTTKEMEKAGVKIVTLAEYNDGKC